MWIRVDEHDLSTVIEFFCLLYSLYEDGAVYLDDYDIRKIDGLVGRFELLLKERED